MTALRNTLARVHPDDLVICGFFLANAIFAFGVLAVLVAGKAWS